MKCEYPNLELLEYKARNYVSNNKKLSDKYSDILNRNGHLAYLDFDVEVFKQNWGSDSVYVSVFHESVTGAYFVFAGKKLRYCIEEINDTFLSDLKEHSLKSYSEAVGLYQFVTE